MGREVSRRGLLAGAVAATAGYALGKPQPSVKVDPKRVLRIAFMTDVHLDAQANCYRGFIRCLKKIHSFDDRPDLIIQGGDLIYDALTRDEGNVQRQFAAAREILDRHCTIPVEHVIGNHDVWGWMNPNAEGITADPKYGKAWWAMFTGYRRTYRSFDKNGWHFVLLDSVMPAKRTGYTAKLDHEQMQWLTQDLAQTPSSTPVCIVSHVPILSIAATFFGPAEQSGHWHVPCSLMHIDARQIKNLFAKHRNIKVCLSGHIHMADRIDYNGVKHFGIGAVSGAWWRGRMQETPPQFGLVDYYSDGHVHTTYVNY